MLVHAFYATLYFHCLLAVPKGTKRVCLFLPTELGNFIYLQYVHGSHPKMENAYKMQSFF